MGHNLSGFSLWSTRRLCKLQAITMTRSEKPSLVLRNTSFTLREGLMPAIACSTLTRSLDILRLFAFSFSVRSFLRGFFSADTFCVPWAHSLESRCLGAKYTDADSESILGQPPFCRGSCRHKSDSRRRRAGWWC